MYEARQNKEKVSRRIEGGGARQNRHILSVIQKKPHDERWCTIRYYGTSIANPQRTISVVYRRIVRTHDDVTNFINDARTAFLRIANGQITHDPAIDGAGNDPHGTTI